jgi:hypothetical protein
VFKQKARLRNRISFSASFDSLLKLALWCGLQRLPEIQQMVRSLSVENDALRKVNVSSFLFYIGEENEKTPGRQHVWSVDMYVRWFRFVADFSGVFFFCVCVCV